MNPLTEIMNRGILFSVGVLFNRVIPYWLFRCRYFKIYKLGVESPFSKNDEVSVELLTEEGDRSELLELTKNQTTDDNLEKSIAFAAMLDHRKIGGVWVAKNKFTEPELGIEYLLGNHTGWIYSTHIARPFRRKGHYDTLLRKSTQRLKQMQMTQHMVAVNPWNRASRFAHEKHVDDTVATLFVVRIFKLVFCFSRGKIPIPSHFSGSATRNPIQITIPSE